MGLVWQIVLWLQLLRVELYEELQGDVLHSCGMAGTGPGAERSGYNPDGEYPNTRLDHRIGEGAARRAGGTARILGWFIGGSAWLRSQCANRCRRLRLHTYYMKVGLL